MKDTPPHLQALEEIEQAGIPGLLEVLREEGTDGVRYALWNVSGWHRDYSPPVWRNRATEEQKREGWEMAVHIEKIIATVLDEAHKRQVEEVMETSKRGRRACTSDHLTDAGARCLPPRSSGLDSGRSREPSISCASPRDPGGGYCPGLAHARTSRSPAGGLPELAQRRQLVRTGLAQTSASSTSRVPSPKTALNVFGIWRAG